MEGIPATEMFNVIPLTSGHATGCLWNALTSYRSYANAHECFEMEGFLRGRCVPRDLKVNEQMLNTWCVNSMRLKLNVQHGKQSNTSVN